MKEKYGCVHILSIGSVHTVYIALNDGTIQWWTDGVRHRSMWGLLDSTGTSWHVLRPLGMWGLYWPHTQRTGREGGGNTSIKIIRYDWQNNKN